MKQELVLSSLYYKIETESQTDFYGYLFNGYKHNLIEIVVGNETVTQISAKPYTSVSHEKDFKFLKKRNAVKISEDEFLLQTEKALSMIFKQFPYYQIYINIDNLFNSLHPDETQKISTITMHH